jgi:hypothetical protein
VKAKRANKTTRRKESFTPAPEKRRLFRIGPGLIIALIATVIIGGNAIKNQLAMRQASPGPIIERHVVTSGGDKAGPIPDVKFLIDRGPKFGLTNTQLSSLAKLESQWEKAYAPLMKEAKAREGKFKRYLATVRDASRTPVSQVQKEAAPFIAISSDIAAARRDYWSQAMALLTPKQRTEVAAQRKAEFARRR